MKNNSVEFNLLIAFESKFNPTQDHHVLFVSGTLDPKLPPDHIDERGYYYLLKNIPGNWNNDEISRKLIESGAALVMKPCNKFFLVTHQDAEYQITNERLPSVFDADGLSISQVEHLIRR